MDYASTRNSNEKVSAAKAIATGIAPDGGLYTPVVIPKISNEDIVRYCKMNYQQRAAEILHLYLDDFTSDELQGFTKAAYSSDRFDDPAVAPVKKLSTGEYLLELWHGPTSAFKDMALQILPHLMTASLKKINEQREVCILVATSGDTGKAALEGFADVKGTKIIVFYPNGGVSEIQKLQMTTQKGNNVGVCAIEGNFDDAQTAVKSIFTNEDIRKQANNKNLFFSSANSINWGRLAPQIVYYISAYCDLVNQDEIKIGDQINVCVPTGNFGNILAAYFAKEMGLPINRLICASNKNRVLTDFFESNVYDAKRDFYSTSSPSMDILISSNLERLLYYASEHNTVLVAELMQSLREKGEYRLKDEISKLISNLVSAGSCDDQQTKDTIASVYQENAYLCDTHTAVGIKVYRDYKAQTGDMTKTVIASTASPFKFCKSVLEALNVKTSGDGLELIQKLSDITNTKAPVPLSSLAGLPERFSKSVAKDKIKDAVFELLNL
ncbi:MAG: threonine synthase [Clostridiales bacterium]|nr:threonine synthase [Clostridiales bacterium]